MSDWKQKKKKKQGTNRPRTGEENRGAEDRNKKKTQRRCERRNRGKTDRVEHRTVETQRREE